MSTTEVQAPAEFDFTQDWVTCRTPMWEWLIDSHGRGERILEIGSFEGRSACWWLEHGLQPNGELYCVDTWEGSPEFHMLPPAVVAQSFSRFKHNIAIAKKPDQKVKMFKDDSVKALASLITSHHENTFDLIYVDGSHQPYSVITDACLAWPLLKPKGLMIFDDYTWDLHMPISQRPKLAVDAFTAMFNSKLNTIAVGDQYVVQKVL